MVEKLIKLNQKGSVGRLVGTNNELPAYTASYQRMYSNFKI